MKVNPIIPILIMGIVCIIIIIIKSRDKNAFIRKIIISILLFLINLRIMVPSSDVLSFSNNLDVLFVIDSTISMVAEDYSGNKQRLEAVKEDCEYIVKQLTGARFSVITFNNESKIITPYTKDSNMTVEAIKSVNIMDELYARGSSLNVAKEDMLKILEKSYEKEDKYRVLFFISDGEITNDKELESFSNLKKYVNNGAVLGYGTETGGNMRIKKWYSDVEEYVQDETVFPYEKAVSKLDESNLNKIAKDVGIDYIKMNKQEDINYKIKEIKKQIVSSEGETNKSSYVDIYYIFIAPLVILLIYEFISYRRRL